MTLDNFITGIERTCAWCPQPNILEGVYAQLVFPFYFDYDVTISHGICEYCARNEWHL